MVFDLILVCYQMRVTRKNQGELKVLEFNDISSLFCIFILMIS